MFCSKQVPNITTITLACYVHPYSSFLTLSNYPQTIVWHTQIVISKSHYSSMAALLCCIHGKAAVITEDKEQLLLIYNSLSGHVIFLCILCTYLISIPSSCFFQALRALRSLRALRTLRERSLCIPKACL